MSDKSIKSGRKGISPKIRFEVFKRDRFTCQYCGETAPSVVLECDHIHPVAEGGTNDLLNLVTSCKGCNIGKGARLLNDDAAVCLQIAQLADLEDRRQQLEMLLQWRDSLQTLEEDVIDRVSEVFRVGGFLPSREGRADIKRWLKRYTPEEIIRAASDAFDTYGVWVDDEKLTLESWQQAFMRTPGVARVQKEEASRPYYRQLFYIRGIIRNKTDCLVDIDYLEATILAGADLEKLTQLARKSNRINQFVNTVDAFLEEEGRPWTSGRPWT